MTHRGAHAPIIALVVLLAPLLSLCWPASAGVYLHTSDGTTPPFTIVHPVRFDGSGGELVVSICTDDLELTGAAQHAIDAWNALAATIENCENCTVNEDAGPSTGDFDAASVVLHEVGHCGLGLDHPDLAIDLDNDTVIDFTSFTASDGNDAAKEWCSGAQDPPFIAEELCPGADGIRGSADDTQVIQPGAFPESIHWFRIADNNPFVVDSTVIDSQTYSRSVTTHLPQGWAANANYKVGQDLGVESTQSVMYSSISRTELRRALTADDVSMVKMGMTGADRIAGNSDDYTIKLRYQADCTGADLVVQFGPDPGPGSQQLASCAVGTTPSFPQGVVVLHHSIEEPGALPAPTIDLNPTKDWDLGLAIFKDGFENGDFSAWNETVTG